MPKPKPKHKSKGFSILWRTPLPAPLPDHPCEAIHCSKPASVLIEIGILSLAVCAWHDTTMRLNAKVHDSWEVITISLGDNR